MLRAYPVIDDFWDTTNSTGVSIDTANSNKMMAGSHITKFHTHIHKELVTTDILNKVSNAPEAARKI